MISSQYYLYHCIYTEVFFPDVQQSQGCQTGTRDAGQQQQWRRERAGGWRTSGEICNEILILQLVFSCECNSRNGHWGILSGVSQLDFSISSMMSHHLNLEQIFRNYRTFWPCLGWVRGPEPRGGGLSRHQETLTAALSQEQCRQRRQGDRDHPQPEVHRLRHQAGRQREWGGRRGRGGHERGLRHLHRHQPGREEQVGHSQIHWLSWKRSEVSL